jgi:hypothetical protein
MIPTVNFNRKVIGRLSPAGLGGIQCIPRSYTPATDLTTRANRLEKSKSAAAKMAPHGDLPGKDPILAIVTQSGRHAVAAVGEPLRRRSRRLARLLR